MPDPLFQEYLPSTLVGVVALGIGVIFFLIEERSATSVVLSASYVCVGLGLALNPPLVDQVGDAGLVERGSGIFEAAAVVFFAQWLRRVAATAQTTRKARTRVAVGVWVLHGLALVYLVLGAVLPQQRLNDYLFSVSDSQALSSPGFWIFATVWVLIADFFLLAWITLVFQRLDAAEQVRATATVVGTPFAIAATALPLGIAELSLTIALLIWLVGFFRYFVIQGERGVFMSRFLSPQVAAVVRANGMAAVMRPHQAELSVVACDLRDFTPYSEAVPSQAVVDLLGEYYEAVGVAVAAHGGTITSYAGDGVLILVGAPLSRADHATAALDLAAQLLEVTDPVLERWSTSLHPLGLGVGVASGTVTVGTIESSSRAEYTAVGTVVNLAARLCSAARSGEVLAAAGTVRLAGRADLQQRDPMRIKGFSEWQEVFVLTAPSAQVARASDTFSTEPGSTTS